MKKIKNNRIKIDNTSSDENEVKTFLIIVGVILILSAIVYFVTDWVNKKNNNASTDAVGIIDYDRLSIGTMLNAPYDEYYVLIYNSKGEVAPMNEILLSNYQNNVEPSNQKKIYFIDLENKLNSKYYNVNNDNKSNPNAKKISDLDLGDSTLIEIKKGSISKYIEGYEKIKKELSK